MLKIHIWSFFEINETALICVLKSYDSTKKEEIIKMLLEKDGIDVNVKEIFLEYLKYIQIITCFTYMFGGN